MRNNIIFSRNFRFYLLAFLFFTATAFNAAAQIVVDNCNTGNFQQFGSGSINDIPATGAIGGSRDVQIANTTNGFMNLNTSGFPAGVLQVRPGMQGNYNIGWGDNDFLGGNELNLNAANNTQIQVLFTTAPYNSGLATVRFNKPGDPDFTSFSTLFHGPGTYTFPFSGFAGLNPADIDGISIGFSNCIADTVIWINQVQINGIADGDGDGITDGNDNCPTVANANQADTDGDGIGNVCDACPNDPNNDADGDGVCGNIDNCLDVANPNQADTDGDGVGNACDVCPLAVPDIANFNSSTCHCEPGYAEIRSANGVVTGCQLCPPGSYCPDGINAYLCAAGTYMDMEGAIICIPCEEGTSSSPGAVECTASDDSDCDGTPNLTDNCPGGDDNGPCNATSFPGFNNIPAGWICGNNNNKVKMCHGGTTICVSPNAVAAHLGHGDFLGPCVSCAQNRSDGNAGLENMELELIPNPATDLVTIKMDQLPGFQDVTLEIYNSIGQIVFQKELGRVSGINQQIDLSSLGNGLYNVSVKTGGIRLEQKLMIVR